MGFFLTALPLLLVIFIDGMGLGLVFPLVNGLIVDPSTHFLAPTVSAAERSTLYGIVIGIFMFCWFFGAALLGDLSDAVGRKKALMVCILGSAGGCFLASLAVALKSVSLLIAGRVVAGFTSGSQPIAQAAMIDQSTLQTKARHLGLILMALSLGFVMGPIVGGVLSDSHLVSWFNFSTPFTAVALLSLCNAGLLKLFFKETFTQKVPTAPLRLRAVKIFISAFQHRELRFLSIVFLLFVLGWSNYYTYATYFVFKKYGFTPLQGTLFMGVLGFGFALGGSFLTQSMTKRLSLKATAVSCALLAAVCILLLLKTSAAWVAWVTVAPTAAFAMTAYTALLTLFSNRVEASSQGWVMGVTGALMAFSYGVVGLLGGALLHGSPNRPFFVAVGGLLTTAFLLFLERPSRD